MTAEKSTYRQQSGLRVEMLGSGKSGLLEAVPFPLLQITPDMSEDLALNRGAVAEAFEPSDSGFFAKPRELPLGVAPRGLLDCGDGCR